MKKLLYIFLILSLIISLAACSIGDDEDSGDGSGGSSDSGGSSGDGTGDSSGDSSDGTVPSKYVFAPGTSVTVIADGEYADTARLVEKIETATGVSVRIADDSSALTPHEIILGESTRDISKMAYRYLERIKEYREGYVGYVIYSDGESVAVAFDGETYTSNSAEKRAFSCLIDELIGDSTVFAPREGRVRYLAYDVIEYQEELDAVSQAAKWATFEGELAKRTENHREFVAAIRSYYEYICTDNVVEWFADLYDADIGGFYFSNSARNTDGFLPDIESTAQALGFFVSSGMTGSHDFPDWFGEQIVRFAKGLQDPNGYFYHPQWDREELENNTQRMGRDVGSAVQVLERFYALPTYDTPTGVKGDGILADGSSIGNVTPSAYSRLSPRLGGRSAEVLASRVVAASTIAGFEQLTSEESFRAYLDDLSARNKLDKTHSNYRSFYQIANELTTNTTQLLERDKQLREEGASYSLAEIEIEWLSAHQNPETGLWDEGLTYANTNAYYKAINVYNKLECPVPRAALAVESIVAMLTSDQPVDTVLYTYNVWGSLNQTMINLREYSETPKEKAQYAEVQAKMLALAPTAINATTQKQAIFKKTDGSITYLPGSNVSTSQNMKVAVPNVDEGDVNSTTLTMGGLVEDFFKTTGTLDIMPKIFTRADYMRLVKRLEGLGEIIKDSGEVKVDYLHFDNDTVGGKPAGVNIPSLTDGSVTVVAAPIKSEPSNLALEFDTARDCYESLEFKAAGVAPNTTCYVFEADFCVPEKSNRNAEFQILMQDSVYMVTLNVNDDEVRMWECSSRKPSFEVRTEIAAVAKVGEWFNFKMVYFKGDKDTVRAKLYFNGELIAVTDNFFDDSGAKLSGEAEPRQSFSFTNVIAVTTCEAILWMDNVACYGTNEVYEVEKSAPINIDAPSKGRVTHSFEGESLPSDFTVTKGEDGVALAENPETGSGSLSLRAGVDYSLNLPINVRSSKSRAVVFESDVLVSADSSGTVLRLTTRENNSRRNDVTSFDLAIASGSGGKVVRLVPSPDGAAGSAVTGVDVPVGESFKLRLEYFTEEPATLIYVNNTLLGLSSQVCAGAQQYRAELLVITSVEGGAGTVMLDNLIFERDELDFLQRVSPTVDSIVHSFKGEDSYASLSGGAVIQSERVKLGSSGAQLKMLPTDRSVVRNSLRFVGTLNPTSSASGVYRFTVHSADGAPIISLDTEVKGKSVVLSEYYAGGTGATLSRSTVGSGGFELELIYMMDEGMMTAYVGRKLVALNTLTHTYESERLEPAYLTVTHVSGSGGVTLDDVICENTLAFYVETPYSNVVLSPENANDFENTHANNPVPDMKYVPRSAKALLGVKGLAVGTDKDGNPIYSKLLALRTSAGSNDTLDFLMKSADKLSSAVCTVFESEIYLDCYDSKDSSSVEVYLLNADGNKVWYCNLGFKRGGGAVTVVDTIGGSGTIPTLTVGSEEKLFKLRLEYAVVDGKLTVNIFVNDSYVATSTRSYFYETPITADKVTGIRFYTAQAAEGMILLDNLKLYHASALSDTNTPTPGPGDGGDGGDDTPGTGGDNTGGDTGEPDEKPDYSYQGPSNPDADVGFDDIGNIPTTPDGNDTVDDSGWTGSYTPSPEEWIY